MTIICSLRHVWFFVERPTLSFGLSRLNNWCAYRMLSAERACSATKFQKTNELDDLNTLAWVAFLSSVWIYPTEPAPSLFCLNRNESKSPIGYSCKSFKSPIGAWVLALGAKQPSNFVGGLEASGISHEIAGRFRDPTSWAGIATDQVWHRWYRHHLEESMSWSIQTLLTAAGQTRKQNNSLVVSACIRQLDWISKLRIN